MNGLNTTNIGLTISLLTKLFKNSCSMNFKQAIGDVEVAEDVFKKNKNSLLTNLQICGNVYVS